MGLSASVSRGRGRGSVGEAWAGATYNGGIVGIILFLVGSLHCQTGSEEKSISCCQRGMQVAE